MKDGYYMRYFIDKVEYTSEKLIELAGHFGWKGHDVRFENIKLVDEAISYLRQKTVFVTYVMDRKGEEKKDTTSDLSVIPEQKDDNMIAVIANHIPAVFNAMELTDECPVIQIYGEVMCNNCKDKGKPSCTGADIIESFINNFGHMVPIGSIPPKDKKEVNNANKPK